MYFAGLHIKHNNMTINFHYDISNEVVSAFESALNGLCTSQVGVIPPTEATNKKSKCIGKVYFDSVDAQKKFYGYVANLTNTGLAWKHEYRSDN